MIPLKLLVSPINETEAAEAIAGGADIIDVKNPKEGALGANYPWVIRRIKEITPKHLPVSCTLGEVPNLPGSISLAALGAASLGVDYIKVGLYGLKKSEDAVFLLQNVVRAAKECNPKVKIVAAAYADSEKIGSINPLFIPEIVKEAHADVAMIDTATKDGTTLFNYLSEKKLKEFVDSAHGFGLETALAGSLRKQDLQVIYCLGADIAGVRSAVCTNSDRVGGTIERSLVEEAAAIVRQVQTKGKRA
jgi:(5-formylfuran-3-yl)methyl phosphate synthase